MSQASLFSSINSPSMFWHFLEGNQIVLLWFCFCFFFFFTEAFTSSLIVPMCGSLCKLLLGPNCAVPAERKTKHAVRAEARCCVGDHPLSKRKSGAAAANRQSFHLPCKWARNKWIWASNWTVGCQIPWVCWVIKFSHGERKAERGMGKETHRQREMRERETVISFSFLTLWEFISCATQM